jgi:predicted urease superfamily metal-dependent hydrolase
MGAAGKGHLKVNWDEAFRRNAPVSSTGIGVVGGDLERLIQGKEHVGIVKAATYLELSIEHIRRLVRKGNLVRLGQGRPMKISVESLRVYKGTAHPGPAKKETPA